MSDRLLVRLRQTVSERPEDSAYRFLDETGEVSAELRFGELWDAVRQVAVMLRRRTEIGDRALLIYSPGLEFVIAFLACSLARVVPVPAHPPHPRRRATLDAVVEDCAPTIVLCDARSLARAEAFAAGSDVLRAATILATDRQGDEHSTRDEIDPAWIEPSDLALLQYTSGSTGTPKGVMVRQDQLAHNEAMIHTAFGIDADSVIVSWLPVYHDMGLIGSVLQPLFAGVPCVLLSPVAFLHDPALWLRAIERFGGTTSGGPNFAYDLCVEKIPDAERARLDLSSWRLAFSGAEPVRAATLERFARAFAPSGFDRSAFYPCYGLAEATLFVAGGRPEAGATTMDFAADALEQDRATPLGELPSGGRTPATRLVGCGGAWLDQDIRIVDPTSRHTLADGRIGEIWVHGPSIAAGYWRRPEQTVRDFHARPLDAPDTGPFLRTGDLGFIHDGELFVSGRLKDLIILRGRNLYPQDIERTAERSDEAFRSAASAAFAVDDASGERLVLVLETERRSLPKTPEAADALAATVRAAVALDHRANIDTLVFVRPGGVPKTSSGKVRRRAAREAFLAGTLAEVARRDGGESATADAAAETARPRSIDDRPTRGELAALDPDARRQRLLDALVQVAAGRLGTAASAELAERPLSALGLDSLAAVELIGALREMSGSALDSVDLLAGTTLAEAVDHSLAASGDDADSPTRRRASAVERLPLSHGQEALVFLHDLAPTSAAYHIAAAASIAGALDRDALVSAVERLRERHPALRTRFHQSAGETWQSFEPLDDEPLTRLVDAVEWSEARLFEALADVAHRPFDLRRDRLLRARLYERGPEEHVLLLVVHHAIGDFWSLTLLLRDLGALYRSEVDGATAGLASLGLDYGDHVLHQRTRLDGVAGERLDAFWRAALRGPFEPLDLPTDRPRPATRSFDGAAIAGRLPARLGRRLATAAANSGTTLYAVLLAGFQATLHRLAGQDRLCVGVPDAGRREPALRDVVGYFVNPVVVASEMTPSTCWHEHLDATRRELLAALRHADYPFELLVRRVQPDRAAGRSPIFQVMHTHQEAPTADDAALTTFALGRDDGELVLGGLRWRSVPIAERAAPMDLVLTTSPLADGGIAWKVQYDRRLFDHETVESFLATYETLLAAALDAPRAPLASLPLTDAERRAWIHAVGNGPGVPRDRHDTLHTAFRRRVASHPDAPALTVGATTLSYGELAARADRLAARLGAAGAGPEMPVVLFLDRSIEMVVALLGVLGVGAAWVPLDPDHPHARLASVLDDLFSNVEAARATPRLALTRAADRQRLAPLLEACGDRIGALDVIEVDDPTATDGDPTPVDEPPGPLTPAALAYTIFTSGSTGRPKGVQVEHAALINFLRSMERVLASDGDTFLALTTLSFDIAVLELCLPLITGGRIVLADRATASDGARLAALADAEAVTILQATPSTWRLLVEAGWRGRPDLVMLSGGEALPADLAERLHPLGRALWNVYGPTETTVWSAARRLRAAETPVRLGGPLDNTRLHVLDGDLRPLPPGITGELWIAGDGLARGYWRRSGATAESFVPDPFADAANAGARLYRTRDLARWRADGSIDFLGRSDHQVKLRGYRIELGEIEAALARHPAIAQAVVVVDRPTSDDPAADRLVAFVLARDTSATDGAVDTESLRAEARAVLPDYMVPTIYRVLDAWPLNPNGKIDRAALARRAADAAAAPTAGDDAALGTTRAPRDRVERTIAEIWCEVLGIERVGIDDNFFDLGGHSTLAARVHRRLRETMPGTATDELTLVELFQYPTVGALAGRLAASTSADPNADPRPATKRDHRAPTDEPIAIVGMAGRFPGAADVDAFWRLLRDGEEAIHRFTDAELRGRVPDELLDDPAYVPARGVLADADAFDAAFFGYTPREADVMDPQHRLFLEAAWHALEDAGVDPRRADDDGGRTAVFAAAGMNTYLLDVGSESLSRAAGGYQAFISNDKDFVPTRVSYALDLRGPSVNVQTACSSSLVAVVLACRALRRGDADRALAGGVTVRFPQHQGYVHEPGGILSPDGHCRAFDARARGTVLGSGLGVVALQPLSTALAEGRRIHAVIRGAAINNDGAHKVGYTAPSLDGQTEVLRDALRDAAVDPASIGYVEAHGTGTELGDPIEVAALGRAYGGDRDDDDAPPIWLGSVKTNLGHLDTAAGVAGLIKAVLSLRAGQVPPSLHFDEPNPRLELGPLQIADRLVDWPPGDAPRRSAVSSFGIGGTNAHVILEQAPEPDVDGRPESDTPDDGPSLLILSARTPAALDASTERLAHRLATESPALDAVAYTLQVGRHAFDHRRFVVVENVADAADALAPVDPARVSTGRPPADAKGLQTATPVAFLFSGQGSQHLGMAADLYASEPVFRAEVDRCADLLDPVLDIDVRRFLTRGRDAADAESTLHQTRVAQPTLFVVEWALVRWWRSLGVEPTAMLGHSLGELVAATVAGVFPLDDALRLVARRGELMQARPPGSMLAVDRSEAELADRLGEALAEGLAVASVNSPSDTVLSGPDELVDEALAVLEADGARCRRLVTSHAFHSPSMRPAATAFAAAVAEVELSPPSLPFVSNVTGSWITDGEATDPEYWGRHLVEPVRFADGVRALAAEPGVFLEIGPGRALATLGKRVEAQRTFVASLPHPRELDAERGHRWRAVGRLWLDRVTIDWRRYHRDRRARSGAGPRTVSLPGYPFERSRFFLPSAEPAAGRSTPAVDPLAVEPDPRRWLWRPVWSQTAPPATFDPTARDRAATCVVYTADDALGVELVAALAAADDRRRLIHVVPHADDSIAVSGAYRVRADEPESWSRLLAKLDEIPDRVIFAPSVPKDAPGTRVLRPAIALLDALQKVASEVSIDLVTFGAHRLGGDRTASPRSAMLVAFFGALEQEIPGLRRRAVDLPMLDALDAVERAELWSDLAAELAVPPGSSRVEVALRHGERRTRQLVAVPPGDPQAEPALDLDPDRVVLVTGGLGGVGSSLAHALVGVGATRLAIVSRTAGLDPGAALAADAASTRRRAAVVDALEAAGAVVSTVSADLADAADVARAVAAIRADHGPIGGVVHAAGRAGGGVWSARSDDDLDAVLGPKVEGTEALWRAVAADAPRFFVLTSSINAVVGGWGQSDYCAANAFQDAFAVAHDRRRGTRFVSLGWDRWRGVGMAAARGGDHPLLGPALPAGTGRRIHRTVLTADAGSTASSWVLTEHRVVGRPTVPGAAYLEMARAAWRETAGDGPVELIGVTFSTPLAVDDSEAREALTVLEPSVDPDADGRTFRVLSRRGRASWQEHCRGQIRGLVGDDGETREGERRDLDALRSSLARRLAEETLRSKLRRGFLDTGERWRALSEIRLERGEDGADELLAHLVLPPTVRDDLDVFGLHPALLDIGTGCMQFARDGDFLPWVYERLRWWAPLGGELWSHLRMRPAARGDEVIHCDLDLLAPDGRLLASVEGFAMRRVGRDAAEALRRTSAAETSPAEAIVAEDRGAPSAIADAAAVLDGTIDEVGAHHALRRALTLGAPAQPDGRRGPNAAPWLVVSPRDLDAVRALYRRFDPAAVAVEIAESLDRDAPARERPTLGNDYVAPGGGLEGEIAAVWKAVLGIEQIGAHDNFFELGGTSLLGVQVIRELSTRWRREIPTVSLFEAPTVASLAAYLAPDEASDEPAFAATRSRAERKKAALGARARGRGRNRGRSPGRGRRQRPETS